MPRDLSALFTRAVLKAPPRMCALGSEIVVEESRNLLKEIGCGGRTRTSDHLINNQALYQLSYTTALLGRTCMVAELLFACQPEPW